MKINIYRYSTKRNINAEVRAWKVKELKGFNLFNLDPENIESFLLETKTKLKIGEYIGIDCLNFRVDNSWKQDGLIYLCWVDKTLNSVNFILGY